MERKGGWEEREGEREIFSLSLSPPLPTLHSIFCAKAVVICSFAEGKGTKITG